VCRQPGQLRDPNAVCPAVEAVQRGAGGGQVCGGVDRTQQFLALPGGRDLLKGVAGGQSCGAALSPRLVTCSAALSSSLRIPYSGSCLRPGGLLHMRGCMYLWLLRQHTTRVQLCALYQSYHAGARAEETAERAKLLLNRAGLHRQPSDPHTASLDRKCFPTVQPNPERRTDQRLRWSGPMWSPPPESNRRPHPYHRCAGGSRRRAAPHVSPQSRRQEAL
jgi:hypothetical protein